MPQFIAGSYLILGLLALLWILVRRARDSWRARSAAIADSTGPPDDPTLVVTLVHGTWGQHSAWTRHSSPLCRSLLALSPGRVCLAPFPWSGRNSTRARTTAAVRLRHHIAGLIERYPAATHFVVAHSHGGNIALYAAQDERVRTGLSGVACLSTPFLHARRRRLGPIAGGHLFAAVFVGFLLLLQGLMQSFGVGENAAMLWSIGISLVLAWLLARLSRSASVRMLDSIRLPDEPPTEMLIIRAMGDEASGVLTATHFLGFLISICWTRPAWMVSEVTGVIRTWGEYARRFARPAVAALVSGGAYMIIDSFYGPLLRLPTLAASAYLVAAGLSIAGAICLVVWWLGAGAGLSGWMFRFALAGMLLIPFVALVLIVALPFGPDFAVAALHLEISAEATPPGTWKVHYLRNDQPYVADVGSDDPLMHSTHHDPRAIAILAEWISSSAGRRLEWPAIGRNS